MCCPYGHITVRFNHPFQKCSERLGTCKTAPWHICNTYHVLCTVCSVRGATCLSGFVAFPHMRHRAPAILVDHIVGCGYPPTPRRSHPQHLHAWV